MENTKEALTRDELGLEILNRLLEKYGLTINEIHKIPREELEALTVEEFDALLFGAYPIWGLKGVTAKNKNKMITAFLKGDTSQLVQPCPRGCFY